jgi:ATP-dependent Clp protease ATP-binding subunit ClpB
MNFNKFTIKSQESVQIAQEIAASYGNQSIEPEHLLAALVQDTGGVVIPTLEKMGAHLEYIRIMINELIKKLRKVYGAGEESQHLGQRLARLFDAALKEVRSLMDEYVSTEYLLLVLGSNEPVLGQLLADQGVTRDQLSKTLKEMRGSQRMTERTIEERHQSLKLFGWDLISLPDSVWLGPLFEEILRFKITTVRESR